ncbi:helix-turn-helix domain-containing protein [Pseudothauera lacus]|uniref:Uncharacterized protein n=1 Tax=Pseudothauera lacus TaxID=2136175 RepID=A0A2T4IHN5_9RHOO|nr:helix-turn-helix domain-containing protein [Pseudothauera lacus]PTD97283.1 hypothetical protein C8261_04535 [Pseudothauera lacus]
MPLTDTAVRQAKPGDKARKLPDEKSTRYFVDPGLLRHLDFAGETTLKRIEPHRLAALILEDLKRYPESAIGDIRQRIGSEIPPRQVKRALDGLVDKGEVRFEGDKRWRRATGRCHEWAIGQTAPYRQ